MNRRIFTVTEITSLVKGILEDDLSDVWIDGEISNLRSPASGHLYFTLKDVRSQIKTVLFKYQKKQTKFELQDGMRIVIHGRVTVYEPRGEYQVIVDYIEPKGLGALQKAYEQLKEKLAMEGLFDEKNKKPIPPFPKKIGIVTSVTGAALQDMLQIIDRRFANIHILICPVKVQGEGAAEEIAHALKELNNFHDIDVIITGRGGGSIEDLWAFNEEIVARAVSTSTIPVISAVGHETDFTIADFVADLRAPTPSAAAELVVKNKEDAKEKVLFLQKRVVEIYKNKITMLKNHVRNLGERRDYLTPIKKINDFQQRTDDMFFTMEKCMMASIKGKRERMDNLIKRLNSVSPLSVLERGFSICTKFPSKKIVKQASDVEKGDKVNIQLLKGKLICDVEEIA